MERRKSKRFSVDGDVKGRMVLLSDCDIRDVSATGMRFLARRRILPNTRVRLDIIRNGRKINLPAQVVRSFIVSTGTPADEEGPLYEVAVLFEDGGGSDPGALESLIHESG